MKKRSLKIFTCILASIILLFSLMMTSYADNEKKDGIHWQLDYVSGTLTVSGNGSTDSFYDIPWYKYRHIIKNVVIEYGITSVSDGMFSDCNNLMYVIIPNSVTTIHLNAFSGCTSLTELSIPKSVTKVIGNIGTSNNLRTISVAEDNQFYYSSGNCLIERSSETIVMGTSFSAIPYQAKSVGKHAFRGCSELSDITVPSSIESIDEFAFADCKALKSITLPESVTYIAPNAFLRSPSLEKIDISANNSVYNMQDGSIIKKSTGELLFSLNGKIPYGTTVIGSYAFCNNKTGSEITVPDGVLTIESWAFLGCDSLFKTKLPDTVVELGVGAFSNCTNLREVVLSENIIELPDAVFSNCVSLKGFAVPTNVTTIGNALQGCNKLENLFIPATVKKISEYAFNGCDSLQYIYYSGSEEEWNTLDKGGLEVYVKTDNVVFNYEYVIYGDLNNDKEINIKDITLLLKYLADWDVTINKKAADTNTDGEINLKDGTLLLKYLADWDVKLGNI